MQRFGNSLVRTADGIYYADASEIVGDRISNDVSKGRSDLLQRKLICLWKPEVVHDGREEVRADEDELC